MTPPSSTHPSSDRPDRIRQVVGDYVRQLFDGKLVDADSIAAEHPDLLPELADALSDAQSRLESKPPELLQTLAAYSPIKPTSREDGANDGPLDATGSFDRQEGTVDGERTVAFDRGTDPNASMDGGRALARGPDHQLLKIHAEGGLGRVWLAHDRHLNRDVALKELRAANQGETSRQTFLKEAQVTAQLEHPNIVPVYQLGVSPADGAPFYTMRMIQGETLAQRIAQYHREEHSASQSALLRRRLLTALIDICNAVAYAHDRGVVHRDLKPLNVVLGKFGEVILLDWGLAKLVHQQDETPQPESADKADPQATTDSVSLSDQSNPQATAEGSILGTPAYMAPEQALGDMDAVGPLTDIYGLGAILFEILTGTAPHRGRNHVETLLGIVNLPVPRARALKPSVPRGLDAVCAKAMAKEPQDRYRSATELADEVERWLADQSVTAYRDPPHVRFLRWARHRKALVSAATVLVLTALVALATTTVLVRREQQQTEVEFQRADRNYRRALAAVDEMLTEVGAEDLANVPQMEATQRRLLERALAFYRSFLDEQPDDPELRLETARAYHRVADILRMLGEHPEAQAEYEHAIAIATELVEEFPAHLEYQQQLAQSHNYLGELFRRQGELSAAQREYTSAANLLQDLVRKSDKPDYQQELARANYNLGLAHQESSRSDQAEKAFREAIETLQGLVAALPQDEYRQELARAQINLGSLMNSSGRGSEAEAEYGKAIGSLEILLAQKPSDRNYRRELAAAYNNLGNLLLADADRRPEASTAFDSGLRLLEELARDYPSVPLYQQELGNSLNSVGGLHFFAGDKKQAREEWRRARNLFAQLSAAHPAVPEFQSKLGATEGNLGWLAMEDEALAEARELLIEAIRHQSSALKNSPSNPTYQGFLRNHYRSLGETLLRQGDHKAAVKTALQLQESADEDWRTTLRAAALSARCVELVREDTALTGDQRSELAGEYTLQAVRLLRSAYDEGLRDSSTITSNKAFDAVRDAQPFVDLLKQIDASGSE